MKKIKGIQEDSLDPTGWQQIEAYAIGGGDSQDGVGRPELTSSHGCTKIVTTHRATICEHNLKANRKSFHNERHLEGTTVRWIEGVEMRYVRTHMPGPATHKWEDNYNHRGPPQGVRGPNSTSGSPARASALTSPPAGKLEG